MINFCFTNAKNFCETAQTVWATGAIDSDQINRSISSIHIEQLQLEPLGPQAVQAPSAHSVAEAQGNAVNLHDEALAALITDVVNR